MNDASCPAAWPLRGHALIVDDDAAVCEALASQLTALGCRVHTVSTYAQAIELVQRTPQIEVAVLDHGAVAGDLSPAILELRRLRPAIVVVGSSGRQAAPEFAAAGVHRFLFKPWQAADLVARLPRRIGECVDCRLPLPLRRLDESETGESWVCCGCGARYRGIMDEEFPDDVRRHVRRPDAG